MLYAQILDRIEAADYDIFAARVRVPVARKALTAARILVFGPPRPRTTELDAARGKELSVAAHAH